MSFQTDFSGQPDELAPAVEQRGFESLWFPDHSHIPASRRTPHPQGIELPRDYWHLLDPFACVNAAAAVTKKLKLGTVCFSSASGIRSARRKKSRPPTFCPVGVSFSVSAAAGISK
jgi:Luciferase-like monooxygenase